MTNYSFVQYVRCTLELKVPLELFAGSDSSRIDDVTLLPSDRVELEIDSRVPELESKGEISSSAETAVALSAENSSDVESWAVGDAVCWPKGDDELPNDAIGRVLRLHDGNCSSSMFDTIDNSQS